MSSRDPAWPVGRADRAFDTVTESNQMRRSWNVGRRREALAPIGLIVLGFVLASGVLPVRYPGPLVVVCFALALVRVMLEDFIRGESRWPASVRPSGNVSSVSRWVTLHGPSARLQTGRFLLLAAVAMGGAVQEWLRPGWVQSFFGPGPGVGALVILIGTFFGMGALAGLLHRPPAERAGCMRAFGVAVLTVQLVVSLVVVGVGWMEVTERGTIASFVRSLNPFAEAAEALDLRD